MSTLRVAIIGRGKMGRAVQQVVDASGANVVAVLGRDTRIDSETLRGADVAIEFTEPQSAAANVKACVDAGCPVVVGTTGWYDQLGPVTEYVKEHDGAVLWSANFSLGVYVLTQLVRSAGALFAALPGFDAHFDAHIVETHHSAKKDAPSGTALLLQQVIESTLPRSVPVTSVRVGSVPGTHELVLDGTYEQIVISHEARDRRVFAEGALIAARWLVGHRGVFTLSDVLGSTEPGKERNEDCNNDG
ncbi:MAG: 4-hydroxy-tetrahydrodipicolinate reductase [Gemmatimonadaceae bacterium]